jgi:hypothetical protein
MAQMGPCYDDILNRWTGISTGKYVGTVQNGKSNQGILDLRFF